ncbi:MAG TPA: HAD family phosphatase [Enterococcus columbae]|nr:HAD family phosphatase [Enterococcus columbae]
MKEIYQGVIFDMDGLLFDTEMLYYEANLKAAKEFGIPYDFSTYKRYIGISDEEMFQGYHQSFDAAFGKETVDQMIDLSYVYIKQNFQSANVELKPGAKELLAKLKELDIKIALASSNTRFFIDLLLAKAEITHYFDVIVSAEDVHFAKPDPEIFELAAKYLGTPKSQTLILEDSKNGVLAAKAANIDVIMIPDLIEPTADLKAKAKAVYSSLNEVIQQFS